ncbi:protein disulfide isomerase family protein LALA0_S02e10748g [Lachancea lanzarotensis]|uniref:LALA0S02e10748g1_1 n=1 Tax=Lachancea lanzarotensis TaxID=1245769 RepID=A0A0C7MUQ1_9SACH|nr:uncharacterized protein LALA0_S02e10748g [Lachancea lanzarotensis]CEP61276.1 LALA0S02e10748g1_1 [Lachancea lanzarotensis]
MQIPGLMRLEHHLNGASRIVVFLVIFTALKTVLGTIIDVETTDDVHSILGSSKIPILVMLYMHGCRYCEELEPNFSYMETLFHDNLALVKVDGKRATGFAREMGVRSFPELILFDAAGDLQDSKRSSYSGKFHGKRDLVSLASFVGRYTGLLPKWRESNIRNVDDLSESLDLNTRVTLLVFVSPWMDSGLIELFAGEQSTSVLDKLDHTTRNIQIFRIDAASESTATWTHRFQVRLTPTLIFLIPKPSAQDVFTEIRIEWRRGCVVLNSQANEILTQIIDKCGAPDAVDSHKCRDYLETLPNVSIHETSLMSGPANIWGDPNYTGFDPNLTGEIFIDNITAQEQDVEDQTDYYNLEDDDSSIFDILREL